MNNHLHAGFSLLPLPISKQPNGFCTAQSVWTSFVVGLFANSIRRQREEAINVPPKDAYDFIVVGGGSAGCVVASRLSEVESFEVVVLERGPEEPPWTMVPSFQTYGLVAESHIAETIWSEPQLNGAFPIGSLVWRPKVLGGGSAVNAMVHTIGHKEDFVRWEAAGNPGWGWEDVLPYFLKSENNLDADIAQDGTLHGVGGPQDVQRIPYRDDTSHLLQKALDQMGVPFLNDLNGPERTGPGGISYGISQTNSNDGRRRSNNAGFLEPVRNKRKNLDVRTDALVSRIIFEGNTAVGVEVEIAGETRVVRARKEVILSAGTYGSPQLLMLSGVGPATHLRLFGIPVVLDLPVGQNYKDHSSALVLFLKRKFGDGRGELRDIDDRHANLKEWLSGNRSSRASSLGYSLLGYYRSPFQDDDDPRPDIQFFVSFFTVDYNLGNVLGCPVPFIADVAYYNLVSLVPTVITPRCTGTITLKSRNVRDQPVLHSNLLCDETEVNALAEALLVYSKLADTPAIRESGYEPFHPPVPHCEVVRLVSQRAFYRCMARTLSIGLQHGMGSCRMGPKWDETAVVDEFLRVRGIENLRVIDASVIPDTITANPNTATTMIAEKGSDLLKQQHMA